MKKIIVANWKALPETLAEARGLVEKLDECIRGLNGAADRIDIVICPPLAFLQEIAQTLPGDAVLGAQDTDPQLVRLGVRYVIIGHSDRRWKSRPKGSRILDSQSESGLGESNEVVNEKLNTALADGLTPIVCLGEQSRTGGWQDTLAAQTVATFRGLTAQQASRCLIAYEPVWAISTNPDAVPDTPASAVQSLSLIREILISRFKFHAPRFLYGGSVTPANASDFLSRLEISGVLVGGASVRAEEFCEILIAAVTAGAQS